MLACVLDSFLLLGNLSLDASQDCPFYALKIILGPIFAAFVGVQRVEASNLCLIYLARPHRWFLVHNAFFDSPVTRRTHAHDSVELSWSFPGNLIRRIRHVSIVRSESRLFSIIVET